MDLDIFYSAKTDMTPSQQRLYLIDMLLDNVDSRSCSLSIVDISSDFQYNKTLIWKLARKLTDSGVIAIECSFEDIASIASICKNIDWSYNVIVFHSVLKSTHKIALYDNKTIIYVLLYKKMSDSVMSNKPLYGYYNVIPCGGNTIEITNALLPFTNTSDKVILFGDKVLWHVEHVKNACRYVVAFGTKPSLDIINNGLYIKR